MKISNAHTLVTTILTRVLAEVDPERLTRNAISVEDDALQIGGGRYELPPSGRIVLLGVGKSAVGMARGVEAALADRLDHGLVVTKRGLAAGDLRLTRTEVIEASHPVPDESSITAGKRLLDEASSLKTDDLVICVISGGGSALVEVPVDGITLDEFRQATSVLLRNGADIWELNAVRRRISRIKAGGLARAIAPAGLVNLILSDVLGNPLGVIASGLSVDGEEQDNWRIKALRMSAAWQDLPESVRLALSAPPADVERASSNVLQSLVIGDAVLAARAASRAASALGYQPVLVGTCFAGDAREFGRFWTQLAKSVATGTSSIETPCCLIGAGEMTVTVRGHGRGGRNTEMATSAALELSGVREIAIASLATDGDDGSSDAAGGVVTADSFSTATKQGLDPAELLERNDTRAFLAASGGLVVTGQTGINVNDLYLALIEKPQ